jgi:hypothetical protein
MMDMCETESARERERKRKKERESSEPFFFCFARFINITRQSINPRRIVPFFTDL